MAFDSELSLLQGCEVIYLLPTLNFQIVHYSPLKVLCVLLHLTKFVADLRDSIFPFVFCVLVFLIRLNYVQKPLFVYVLVYSEVLHEVRIKLGSLNNTVPLLFLVHFFKGVPHNCNHHVQEHNVRHKSGNQKQVNSQV